MPKDKLHGVALTSSDWGKLCDAAGMDIDAHIKDIIIMLLMREQNHTLAYRRIHEMEKALTAVLKFAEIGSVGVPSDLTLKVRKALLK